MATNTTTPPTQEYIPFRLPAFTWGRYARWAGYFVALVFIMWLGARIDGNPRGFVQATLNGVLVGGIYSLVAVGIVMINKASGIFNFAHGSMMLFSALIFFSFFTTPPGSYNLIAIVILTVATVIMYFSMNNLRDMLQPRNLIIGVIAAVLLFVGMTLGGNTNSQINDYTLPEDGTYTVVVSTLAAVEGEEPQTGLFRTSISVTGANGGAPVRQTNSGSFTEEAQTFTYTFEASAGAAASVSASSTEADTYITLLAPDETVLAENDDKGSPYSFLSGISEDFYKSLGTSDTSMRLIRALFGAVVAAVLIGLMIERFSIRPLVGQPIFTLILMTLALERVFFGISLMVWGSVDKSLPVFTGLESLGIPSIIRIDAAAIIEGRITTVNIDSRLLVAFGFALLVFLAFVLFFQYTNVGLAMRATSENQVLAQSVGMRVRAILAIAWAIATLLALAAGGLYGAASNIGTSMSALAFLAFPAVLLGGLESIGGALVGGIIIGLSQTWADLLFGNDAGTQLAPYVILMIVLIIRPDGLFGQKRIERI